METQTIIFDNREFCTVFEIKDVNIVVKDKMEGTNEEVNSWLEENNYPRGSLIRCAIEIQPGFYIKPYASNRYFQIHPDTNNHQEVAPDSFKDIIIMED